MNARERGALIKLAVKVGIVLAILGTIEMIQEIRDQGATNERILRNIDQNIATGNNLLRRLLEKSP